ncbi:hypothetical protein BIW11_04566, partial [Tropilaelaps mercedesae]
ELIVVFLR